MSSNLFIPKSCKHCGKAFTARTTVTNYCGDTCAKKAYKARKRNEKIQTTLNKAVQQPREIVNHYNPDAVMNCPQKVRHYLRVFLWKEKSSTITILNFVA
jgi:hypothetical protein